MRGRLGALRTAARVVGRTGYHLTYTALTHPDRTRQFIRAIANAVADFEPEAKRSLPTIPLSELCHGLGELELPLRLTASTGAELPIDEYVVVAALVRAFKPKTVFEFGTNRGRTTQLIAEHAGPEARIYTLDLPPELFRRQALPVEAAIERIGEAFLDSPIVSQITQCYGDSRTFDFSSYYGAIDLVFVDADHRYEAVRHDTQQALRMVRPGGLVIWDDYGPGWPGVVKCLEEVAAPLLIRRIRETRLVCFHAPEE